MNYLKQEQGFYKRAILLMLPMIMQNFITHFMATADTFMVGALGETELAAVTMANSPFFVVTLLCFGIQSGASILASQYHGLGDKRTINRIMGVGLYVSMGVTSLVALAAIVFPGQIMGLLTNNPQLIEPGAAYARIAGPSFFFMSISGMYIAIQRSTENTKLGAAVLTLSGILNIFLNWLFIFGMLGAPRMGVAGAALGTLLSRVFEVLLVTIYAFKSKRIPLVIPLVLKPGKTISRDFLKYALPVAANELLWSSAISIYSIIMGHMPDSTRILAAYTIAGNLDRLLSAGVFAVGGAAAIIIGRDIGKGNHEDILNKGMALNALAFIAGCATCVACLLVRFFAARQFLFPLLGLSEGAQGYALFMITVVSVIQPIRSLCLVNVVGILRGGGDVRFALLIDIVPMYAVGVPLAALFGLVLNFSIYAVYLCIFCDEFIKFILAIRRIKSGKWINNLTRQLE